MRRGRPFAPESLLGDAFDRVMSAWARSTPKRVSPQEAAKGWLIAAASVGPDRLARAALRYLAQAAEVKRGRCKALHLWLSERRYEVWLERIAEADVRARPSLFPEAEIRAQAVAVFGEDRVRSALDPSAWDAERRVITPFSTIAGERLRERPALWERLGVTIGEPASRDSRSAA